MCVQGCVSRGMQAGVHVHSHRPVTQTLPDSPAPAGLALCSLHLPRGPWALRSLSGCPLLPSPKQHQQQLRATAPRGRPPPSCLPAAGTSPPGLLLAAASRCVSRAPNTSPQGSVSGQLLLRKASLPFDAKTPIQGVLLSLPQRDQPGGPEWGGRGLCGRERRRRKPEAHRDGPRLLSPPSPSSLSEWIFPVALKAKIPGDLTLRPRGCPALANTLGNLLLSPRPTGCLSPSLAPGSHLLAHFPGTRRFQSLPRSPQLRQARLLGPTAHLHP